MSKSTKSPPRGKDSKLTKLYPDYPLFPDASGRWAKKIRQRTCFLERWGHEQSDRIVAVEDIPAAAALALEEFNRQWPYLSQGRTPPPIDSGHGYTVRDLVNGYLTAKRQLLDAGEITARTLGEYYSTCERVISIFGRDLLVEETLLRRSFRARGRQS